MTPIILELLPKDNQKIDFSRFVVQYSNNPSCVDLSDYDVNYVQGSPIDHFREEFLEYIKKFGLHSYLGRQLLAEAIIRPGETQANIVDFLKLYIDAIEMDNELIIIDQHLFPGNVPAGYVCLSWGSKLHYTLHKKMEKESSQRQITECLRSTPIGFTLLKHPKRQATFLIPGVTIIGAGYEPPYLTRGCFGSVGYFLDPQASRTRSFRCGSKILAILRWPRELSG
jgi:hypothetical protein